MNAAIAHPGRRPRSRRAAAVAAVSLSGAVAVLVAGAPTTAWALDQTPPKFAGLESATTCVAGPAGEGVSSSYHLSWERARDKRTRSSRITYNVYQATKAGGEDFSKPTYTTAPGATSFDTPALPSGSTF